MAEEIRKTRTRLRELGITIGRFPTGPLNAITDVPGILVGHTTIIRDSPSIARTGITAVVPRNGLIHEDYPFAGFHSFNGVGEMTGIHLIKEWGVLSSPILLTNTNQVGMALDALVRYGARKYGGFAYKLPVVTETYDGVLNDIDSFPLTEEDIINALETASAGSVLEGNVGGGTGMISFDFKGGIGTSSRIVFEMSGAQYTIGVLVQTNHGARHLLRVNNVPVGELIPTNVIPAPEETVYNHRKPTESSSIIVIIATDAPLIPTQCNRLARRATIGLARTGGVGYNTSGDLFLCFSTGNHYDPRKNQSLQVKMIHHGQMDPFIEATAEAVEEAILNALTSAETMAGYRNHTAHALPLKTLAVLCKGIIT